MGKVGTDYPVGFNVVDGTGAPATGIAASITSRVRALGAAVDDGSVAAVVEIGNGRYSLIIRGIFTTAQGADNYEWTAEVTSASPFVQDVIGDTIRFTVSDADDLATDVWSEALPGAFGANTAGERVATTDDTVGTNLDVVLSTRSSHSAADAADAVWDEPQAGHTTAATFGRFLDVRLQDMAGATFSTATDSLEAIRDRGDAAWITAVGFSTHTAGDIWDELTSAHTVPGSFGLLVGAASTDWSTAERNQIRLRLGIDGTQATPTTVVGTLPELWYVHGLDTGNPLVVDSASPTGFRRVPLAGGIIDQTVTTVGTVTTVTRV